MRGTVVRLFKERGFGVLKDEDGDHWFPEKLCRAFHDLQVFDECDFELEKHCGLLST